MKKSIISLISLLVLFVSAPAFANNFDTLDNLTPVQKQKLNQIFFNYKQQNNALQTDISSYQDKLNRLEKEISNTPDQKKLLKATYERNVQTLMKKQADLQKATDDMYKSVLTLEQYKQYQQQQVAVKDAFSQFLQK